MTRIAYLDISPRQTGKTDRMLARAASIAQQGHTVIYVSPKLDEERKSALELAGVLVLEDSQPIPDWLNADSATWFYDEFDWLKSTVIREGGYYATTAKRLRFTGRDTPETDLLLALLKANGYRHDRHYWPFDMSGILREARACHSPAEFRLLYLGEFLS